MAKKMPRPLVALSASAIAAVYLTGYVSTGSADTALARGTDTRRTLPASLTLGATSAPQQAPATTAGSAVMLRDGTFRGTGTSRRGNVSVAVTVQGGRIAGVSITGATTQYPTSRIAALPGQVMARQSAQIDRVSGATYSAMAFQQAVQQALAQAQVVVASAAAATGQGVAPSQSTGADQFSAPAPSGAAARSAQAPQSALPAPREQRTRPAFSDRESDRGRSERQHDSVEQSRGRSF